MEPQRGNSKHGPRTDDAMVAEVQGTTHGGAGSRAEEWHQAEPAGEDQPAANVVPPGHRTGVPQGMTTEEVEQRSQLGRYISLSALPGDRAVLRLNAEENDAPDEILAQLDQLPDNTTFETVSEVWAALGHANETRRW
ncbi:Protein of unknown function [Micromonospora pattaloongensis]|uniref:DUF2795 domain-containing protein n=1 Tax=Micromonospora pattaloongensis TaxID=405436 RepID=A0A1H3S7Z9_9ACTN|nr:DUF2795 domain-containing protein [Micromonospora pattaloongensis]SDZ33850.1 Protein of unknown function [Micromonospora pattaloongensis]